MGRSVPRRTFERAAMCFAFGLAACGLSLDGEVGPSVTGEGPDSGGPNGSNPDGSTNADGANIPTNEGGAVPKDDVPLDPKAACGKASAYVDDFDDGKIGTDFSAIAPAGASITESGGQLVVAHAASSSAALISKFAVDLRADRLRVKLSSVTSGTRALVAARNDATHELSMLVQGTSLVLRRIDGAPADDVTIAY